MIKEALRKLNEKQTNALNTYSALIERARENGLKEEFERQTDRKSQRTCEKAIYRELRIN